MDDLISRQAAVDAKNIVHIEMFGRDFPVVPVETLKVLPPVDAVPVVHGEWVWVQYDANPKIGNFHCSKCRFIPADFNMAKQHLKYCPECGAKMDRKDGDNG